LRGIEDLGETGELYFYRDGYGGLSGVEGGRTNLCFITSEATLRAAKGDRQALLEMTLMTNPAARARLRTAAVDGEWVGTGPITHGRQASMLGVIAIGDAGAFIDPFTGSGILLALTSAELASTVIEQSFARGETEPEVVARRFRAFHRAEFSWRFRACALLRHLALRPVTHALIASLLSRYSSLAKLMAASTRQRGPMVGTMKYE
jgi:flavin-dependent dehydrogenase